MIEAIIQFSWGMLVGGMAFLYLLPIVWVAGKLDRKDEDRVTEEA